MRFFIVAICLFIFLSCKKENKPSSNPDVLPAPQNSELSAPIFETEYGNCYDFDDIQKNPLTILASNNLIISSIYYDGTTDKLLITKVNQTGGTIWQKNFTWSQKFKSGQCFETTSGDLIVIGASYSISNWVASKVYIAKLNALNGDTIWTRTYGHNYIDRGLVGYEDANSNYWIVDFNNQDNKATLLKIGSNGDSLTSIIDSPHATYKDAMITNNQEIIIVGESSTMISSKRPVYITKYSNGVKGFSSDIILNNYDDVQVSDVCQTLDGGFVVAGVCSNFANTTFKYGFLLKTDAAGNKLWEKVLTQFNNSQISSCVEKQQDVFYLGIGSYSSGKLYKYDLNNLTILDNIYRQPDAQLLIKNNTLYRGIIETNSSFYETVKVKVHTIN
jgi:hypothetical protein